MSDVGGPDHARARRGVVRFDVFERSVHWVSAALFTVLIVTAIPLYFGSLFGVMVPRFDVEQIHLWAGLALPVPFTAVLLSPGGARLRRDVRRVNDWTVAEIAWLRSWGRVALETDKFNPAQKLNAIVVAASSVVLLVTGVILKWFNLVPVSWRGGATFVHDAFAWLLAIAIAGHVVMAVTHPEALRSMLRGRVSESWAARHAPRWLDEGDAREARESRLSDDPTR